MKTVTFLLTKFTDIFGKFISWYSNGGYTHASISIDEDEEIFYSFSYKGFVIEKPKKRHQRNGNRCLMHIPFKFKNRYFCSQFVAEILEHAGAVRLKKKNTLYLPHQLLDGMEFLFPGKKVLYGSFAVA
jgi:hypothetical protein